MPLSFTHSQIFTQRKTRSRKYSVKTRTLQKNEKKTKTKSHTLSIPQKQKRIIWINGAANGRLSTQVTNRRSQMNPSALKENRAFGPGSIWASSPQVELSCNENFLQLDLWTTFIIASKQSVVGITT
ncbi:hypothetical protein Adt_24189 [Abeliophyllum distichum]|uniref:Uncharacterized protein n=1 Tax=Abeliophyllum distichum TaxID=126358 RepID=A0ABD1SG67_9LAMI